MRVIRSHKIALNPTPGQTELFKRAAGVARFVWNWALAEWNRQYRAGEKPTALGLKKQFNAIKGEQFAWVYESPRDANAQPFVHLGNAFNRYFRGNAKRPKFKKKGKSRDSFYVANDRFRVDGETITLPRIGRVRMREALRFEGKTLSATVSRTAQRWFVAINVAVDLPVIASENQASGIGVDLGVKNLATLAGPGGTTIIEGPKPLRGGLKRLARLNRGLSRKVKGSGNWEKARRRLAGLHARVAEIRADSLHKLTTRLVKDYRCIIIEDLNVKGMMRDGKLARLVGDMGFGEFRRQLDYKQGLSEGEVIVADRWFPSSKLCRKCGLVNESLALGDRTFHCSRCRHVEDRDIHAARNLERYPRLIGESEACGHSGSGLAAGLSSETRMAEAGIPDMSLVGS